MFKPKNKQEKIHISFFEACLLILYFHACIYVTYMNKLVFKDLNSTEAKRGSVFIGLMTPDGAIWFRY